MILQKRATGEMASAGGDRKSEIKVDQSSLKDYGISSDQGVRWTALADMPEDHFETAVATAKDTAGQVTTAFMLREAAKAKPQGKPKTGPKAESMREELKAAQERGTSMLETYLRLTIRAVREQDSFTDQERSLIGELMDALTAMTV